MNESWHIPRASLAGASSPISSSNSNKSNSNRSTVSRNFKTMHYTNNKHVLTIPHLNHIKADSQKTIHADALSKSSSTSGPKRGSRSSQGSYDSSSSTRSASSGSLLLTAANLERFAKIHRQQNSKIEFFNSNYNVNLTLAYNNSNLTMNALVGIKPNLNYVKTKDVDTMSVASSTHFTMVNGEIGSSKKTAGSICSSGKQVTVLIISMSLFFLVLISGMVYALEMRAREMPKS